MKRDKNKQMHMRTDLVRQPKALALPYARLWVKRDKLTFWMVDMPPAANAAKLHSRSPREKTHAEGQTV